MTKGLAGLGFLHRVPGLSLTSDVPHGEGWGPDYLPIPILGNLRPRMGVCLGVFAQTDRQTQGEAME